MKVKSMIKKIVMWNGRHNFGVGVVLKIFNNNVIRWLYFLNLRCSTGLGWKGDGNLSPPFDKLGVAAAHIFKVALRVNWIDQGCDDISNDKTPFIIVNVYIINWEPRLILPHTWSVKEFERLTAYVFDKSQYLEIAEELKDIRGKAIRLNIIGFVYKQWRKPEKALEYYKKAISIFKDLKDERNISIVKGNIDTLNVT